MTFVSPQFLAFFAAVFLLYLFLGHKQQNRLLLIASCLFYAAWDWRFLFLIFVSITTDYFCGLTIHETADEGLSRRYLILSLTINLSILALFKYFNFFAENFSAIWRSIGLRTNPLLLRIGLPLGISYYTFKSMSYTLDIYMKKCEPTRDYLDYALFVAFFPQITSGPIMKARELLPQISSPRVLKWESFYKGCYLFFWGLFQKVFVANHLASIADSVFAAHPPYFGYRVLLALYAFAFQLYCDFGGYSLMSQGLGECLGFHITSNFDMPYFSRNPQEFWQRWHISLSTWLREYLFTPIAAAARDWGRWGVVFALMVTFVLCGLWHGPAWTFVLWGTYWGVLLSLYQLCRPIFSRIEPKSALLRHAFLVANITFFFHLTCFGYLLFAANDMSQVHLLIRALLNCRSFEPYQIHALRKIVQTLVFYPAVVLAIETWQFIKKDSMVLWNSNAIVRGFFYFVCVLLFLIYWNLNERQFIYFKF